jgi:thymidylate synthase (FAD)
MVQFAKPSVEKMFITPNAELFIERVARTCYKSEDKLECGNPECVGGHLPLFTTDGPKVQYATIACPACAERAGKFIRERLMGGDALPNAFLDHLRERITALSSGGVFFSDKSQQALREMILGQVFRPQHTPMVEFGEAIFRTVTDRGVTHEIVRHRLCSYAQESTRYCNYSKGKFGSQIAIIDCQDADGLTEAQRYARLSLYEHMERVYKAETDAGISPQIARDVLPNILKTEIIWKANFAEWRHILKMRFSKKAHPHMYYIAGLIRPMLKEAAPNVFFDR